MKYLRKILEGKEEDIYKIATSTIDQKRLKGISEISKSEGVCTVKLNIGKRISLSSFKKLIDTLSEINDSKHVEMSEMELWSGPKGKPQLVVDFYTEGDDTKDWSDDLPF